MILSPGSVNSAIDSSQKNFPVGYACRHGKVQDEQGNGVAYDVTAKSVGAAPMAFNRDTTSAESLSDAA